MAADRTRALCAAAGLLVVVVLSYGGVLRNDFIDFDDTQYITDNAMVRQGLTPAGLAWAFTTTEAANWHPLTWISHQLDVQLFGLNPHGHHAVSLLLHAINACLVLAALYALTGALWRSAAVAALFAVHPLHVESVAWAAERKNVLSTLFFLVTLLAYRRYASRPGGARLALVAALLAAGLLAKPMLVTLPFVLLLLDFWPLGRFAPSFGPPGARPPGTTGALRLIVEKVPLLLLAAASSAVTFVAQRDYGAIASSYPLAVRVSNAVAGYVAYLGKMLWPRDLSFFYAHPGTARPLPETAAALGLLAALTALAALGLRRRPYLGVGWLWYLGTLVPVIGLVQVGSQAMADRYAYIPLLGLFVALVWLAAAGAARTRFGAGFLTAALVATLVPLGLATRAQVALWRDTTTLTANVSMGLNNWVAQQLAGRRLFVAGRLDEAIAAYREAIRLNPSYDSAYYNLGIALMSKGLREEAMAAYRQALHLKPDNVDAHVNLGAALAQSGDLLGAIEHFKTALGLQPDLLEARANIEIAERQLERNRMLQRPRR
jgi:tetratricopeptide (TPR) repeat protein